ncbi:MAG: phospho-N-acetylmuramoyl-pentapeptide-transferase [Fusobacteriaceae bacterium]|nr:phospho-N-acetylmuramoyl-pentapeptide-transferase [Fusobacteriaceae bacterium]
MLYILSKHYAELHILSSIYLRVALAFLTSFFFMLILGKPFINYLKKKKFGESIREDGPESHFSKKGTPTMGGVLIVASILFTSIITTNITNNYIILLLLVTLLFASIGFIDDYTKFTVNKKGLSGKKKLLGQFLIAIVVWIFITYFKPDGMSHYDYAILNPLIKGSFIYVGGIGTFVFITLILMGASNAVNITDGLDGLAIMPVVISGFVFAVIAYFTGHIILSEHLNIDYAVGIGEITVFLATMCGAGLGFLWYNFYPAQIFMGDTGSLTLGGMLGTVAILLKQELLLPIVGIIFVIEAMSVIIQVFSFKVFGKRVFKMAPIHHHYELLGKHEAKVTMRFWIISIMFGTLALAIVRLRGI